MKNLPEPTLYDLEFSSGATFWTEGDAFTRRVYLMPLPNPAEFVAFGVLHPSDTLHFVARGSVMQHLGDFLASMGRAQARVELHAVAPLPKQIIKKYTSDDPFEGTAYDNPPPPPKAGKIMGLTPTVPDPTKEKTKLKEEKAKAPEA